MRCLFCILAWLVLFSVAGFPFQAAAAGEAKILVVGDSLSAGYGLAADESWVSLLDQRLTAQGYEYQVVNASVTGDTTRGGRARIARALARHKPALLIIELGGNDGLRGIRIEEMRENLAAMIEAGQASGAKVLLISMKIPPNYGAAYAGEFAETYALLASKYGLPAPPFLLTDVALDNGLMQADGIHPNARAQPLMLDNVWPALSGLLQRTPCAGKPAKSLNEAG